MCISEHLSTASCFTNIILIYPHANSKAGSTIILILLKVGEEQLAEGSTAKESMLFKLCSNAIVIVN